MTDSNLEARIVQANAASVYAQVDVDSHQGYFYINGPGVNQTTVPRDLYSQLAPKTIHDPTRHGSPAKFAGWRNLR